MSLVRVNPRSYARLVPIIRDGKSRSYSVAAKEEEYSDTPEYPPVLDTSFKAKMIRKQQSWHEEIKKLNTVEEKLMKINMPRYYGWKSVIVTERLVPYNVESFAQHVTRTHLVKDQGLPNYYDRVITGEKLDATVQQVKKQIEDAIVFENVSRRRQHELDSETKDDPAKLSDVIGDAIVYQINRILLTTLSFELPHLLETQIDHEPRIEAFWFVGGMEPPMDTMLLKKSSPPMRKIAKEPADRRIQYKGDPTLQLRHHLPLKEIVSLNEAENPAFDVPKFTYDPRVLAYTVQELHGTSIPGFWPGDSSEFGILSYHRRGHVDARNPRFKDENDALNVQALYASYAWLLGQACYQGFSTFTELTYPLLTQTVITNGQLWSLYAYQMNTTLVHSEHIDKNPRRNLCWSTGPLKLYEKIEGEKIVGFNDDVLKSIIKLYANSPQERRDLDMKPYLGKTEQKVADIEDPERREWLEAHYKHLVANRKRHERREEINHWELIYKIKFNTRPLDKKRKKWERGIYSSHRRLDEHAPVYIPKILRPDGPRSKKKFRKTYYP